jgi:dTDP-4-dehydrorhamnose 3,5-epimerase-like enzyme
MHKSKYNTFDNSLKNCRTIELPRIVDEKDGIISVAESFKNIPFAIKRVYYIYQLNYNDSIRGKHAHKKLEQILFCINGSVVIDVDDGEKRQNIKLDKPNIGLYLGPELWHVMRRFSHNCILLVFASDFYNEEDYIRNYDEFLAYICKNT